MENKKERKLKMEKNKRKLIKIIVISVIIVIILAIVGGVIIKNNMNEDTLDDNNNVSVKKEKTTKKDKKENKEPEVKIVKNEAQNIKLEDFDNGLVSMKIPKGWKVDTVGDYIHYTVKVYNPENPTYQFFFNMKTEAYNKSQDAKSFYQRYYPNEIFAKNPVIEEETTEGFYKIFNEMGILNNTASFTFPTLSNFKLIENLGSAPMGGDLLRASFTDENGKEGEGIFTAYVYDAGSYYMNENIISGKQIDTYPLSVHNTVFITAQKDELIDWEDTLNQISSSLQFSDTFISQYNNQQDAVMTTFQNIRSIGNQTSDMIMSAWESRSAAYDRMSQKQSDAILGYERVYDTENGEIYKAYNGFTDDYTGERYKSISDDMYTKPTDGYIEK
mgnify:CR=1 FL=1